MQNIARSRLLSSLLLVLTALGTLFYRLGSLPFIGADEPRYARIAQEMKEAGRWITPLLEGRPWLEKPPLYYWMTIPFYSLFGVSEYTARAGNALAALLAAFAILWLGARLWSRLAGLLAAGIFLTSMGVVAFGRGASTDMPITACLTLALSLFAAAVADEGFARWKTMCAWGFLGLGVLAKGPVAFLLGVGIGLAFWLLDEKGGVLRRWHILSGAPIAAAVSLPWFWLAFKENGFAFIAIFFVNHNLARYITDLHHHTEGSYYYFLVLPGLLFPWTGWLILLVPRSIRETVRCWKKWDSSVLFVACWALFPLFFFSLSSSKLPGYILPSIPPLALLLGKRLAGWIEGGADAGRNLASAWFQFLLSGALAIAFPLVMRPRYGMSWMETLTISALTWVPALLVLFFASRGRATAVVRATFLQGVLLVLALTQFAFPALARMESTKGLAARIASIRMAGEPLVTYHAFHHSLHYYTGYTISEDLQDHESLLAFVRPHAHVLVVAPAAGSAEMQNLPGFSAALVGEQGKLRLFRLSRF